MRFFLFVFLILYSCGDSSTTSSPSSEEVVQEVSKGKISIKETQEEMDTIEDDSVFEEIDTIKEHLETEAVPTKISFAEIEEETFLKYFLIKTESVDTAETMVTRTDTSFLVKIENEHIAFKANEKDDSEISYYIGWLRAIDYHIISTTFNGGAYYAQSYLMNGVTGNQYSLDANSDFNFNRFEVSPNQQYLFLGLDNLYSDDSYILIQKINQEAGIYHLNDYTNYSAEGDWMIQKMAWADDESFVLKVIYNGRTFNSEDEDEDTEEDNGKGKIGFLKGVIE